MARTRVLSDVSHVLTYSSAICTKYGVQKSTHEILMDLMNTINMKFLIICTYGVNDFGDGNFNYHKMHSINQK